MVDWEGAFASHSALKAHLPYEPFPLQMDLLLKLKEGL